MCISSPDVASVEEAFGNHPFARETGKVLLLTVLVVENIYKP